MESSGLRFDSSLPDEMLAAAAGRTMSGTTAAANPRAEIPRKLRREVWLVVGVSSKQVFVLLVRCGCFDPGYYRPRRVGAPTGGRLHGYRDEKAVARMVDLERESEYLVYGRRTGSHPLRQPVGNSLNWQYIPIALKTPR